MDKEPSRSQKKALWAYFGSECAYCGEQLVKGERKAHIDHLEANGCNHISNRVLSCNICNGDEKRETDWERFLAMKCGDDQAAFVIRRSKIIEWRKHCGPPPTSDPAILVQVQTSIEACNKLLDEESNRIRLLVARQR